MEPTIHGQLGCLIIRMTNALRTIFVITAMLVSKTSVISSISVAGEDHHQIILHLPAKDID
ncbi:hypothetical protein CVS40_8440 [Lucilia cuprina]|nr:hypothetical protein CVS40_8440 [Lucilia cuprina]